MDKKIQDIIKHSIKAEKETLEEGNNVMMKIMAIDTDGMTTLMVFADYEPSVKSKLLRSVGNKLRETIGDKLKTLILISDTYAAKIDVKNPSPIEQIIASDLESGKLRLENLPPELHKFRIEALVFVISEDKGKTITMSMVPYSKINGKVVFEDEDIKFKKCEDNMLVYVWEGYKN